jgi:dolichyl-diphosphooligosaccharide--protein glycosyltransferase
MDLGTIIGKIKGVDRRQLFFVALIFLLGFGVRGHLLIFDYMFGFDPYYHTRMIGFLIQNGYVPEHDMMSYYFMGGATPPGNVFFWYFEAAIYKIFTLNAPYDKWLWIQFAKVLPALFGALTAAAMFFFGKELYGRKAGYVMAFMAAVVPSFVYRTMAGTNEDDCLGFLWMVIGFVFFVRAVKNPVFNKKGLTNAILAGFFFAVMAITWEMYMLIPLVLVCYFPFALIHIYSKRGFKQSLDFIKLFAVSFAILFAVASVNYGPLWFTSAISYATKAIPGDLEIFVCAGIALLAGLFVYLGYKMRAPAEREGSAKTINLIALILLFVLFLSVVISFLTIDQLFKPASVLGQSVGEENTGKQFFAQKYNALIVFPWLALLLIPIRMYREKDEHLSAIVFFWVLITLFMAWYKLKFTFTFGLPIAAAAGFVAAELLYYCKSRNELETKIIGLSFGLMLLVGVAAAAVFVPDNFPHIEMSNPTWKKALLWMQKPENVPTDAKMFNWWDEGHWISFVGERAVLIDNRNLSWEADSDFAKFVVTKDVNEAVAIIKKYGSDYVILSNNMFLQLGSFGNYAYNTSDNSDPRFVNFFFSPHNALTCNKTNPQGEVRYSCGGNNWSEQQMDSIPTVWQSQAFNVTDQSVPYVFYRDEDKSNVYFLNLAVNETMLSKVWFHQSDAMLYFEEVYSSEGIKIFKVKKDKLP